MWRTVEFILNSLRILVGSLSQIWLEKPPISRLPILTLVTALLFKISRLFDTFITGLRSEHSWMQAKDFFVNRWTRIDWIRETPLSGEAWISEYVCWSPFESWILGFAFQHNYLLESSWIDVEWCIKKTLDHQWFVLTFLPLIKGQLVLSISITHL